MSERGKTIKLYEEIVPLSAPPIPLQQKAQLQMLCQPLAKALQQLEVQQKEATHDITVDQKIQSIRAVANFAGVYADMATFCKDNKIMEVINLSPHFMFASPFFREATDLYVEIHPTRFGAQPEATLARGWTYDSHDIFAGRYLQWEFCDELGCVNPRTPTSLVISADILGWPGVLKCAGFKNWDFAYRNLAERAKHILAYMPKESLPKNGQFPGQTVKLMEHYRPDLRTTCGLYLLTQAKQAVSYYKEDMDLIKDLLKKN